MSNFVIDASVLLTVMLGEPGADEAYPYLTDSVISTVNLAEVQTRVVRGGFSAERAWAMAISLLDSVKDFDSEQARLAGDLIMKTREFGLSFGDRACLALGMVLGVPVCTTDRAWSSLNVGVKIHIIR